MPGLFDGLWHGRPAEVAAPEPALPEPQGQFDPQVIAYVNNGVNPIGPAVPAQAGIQGGFINHFQNGEWPPVQPVAPLQNQYQWDGFAVQAQQNAYMGNPQPWEFRQQIYPPAIETRLSKEDVERIAERILVLIEEREAE